MFYSSFARYLVVIYPRFVTGVRAAGPSTTEVNEALQSSGVVTLLLQDVGCLPVQQQRQLTGSQI